MKDENEINQKLNKSYDYLCTKYGKEHIFGIFAFGKINYGAYETIADLKLEAIYLPSFEEICFNEPLLSNMDNNILIRDVRFIYHDAISYSTHITEGLYTDYRIVNPLYEYLFEKYFYNNRELISAVSKNRRLRMVASRGLQYYEDNDIKMAKICLNFCDNYYAGMDYKQSLKYQSEIKDGLEIRLIHFVNHHPAEKDNDKEESLNFLRIAISGIIRQSLNCLSPQYKFMKSLSDIEKLALRAILGKLENGEGIVSLTKVCQEAKVARQYINELVEKLKVSGLVIIIPSGRNGTYIKILDDLIFDI